MSAITMLSGQRKWLTAEAEIAAKIDARLRQHNNSRIVENAQRPLILIGNGTGLAGLRSHLKARAASANVNKNAPPNWRIFGERNAAHDSYYRDEIDAWQKQGILQRIGLVFSRDHIEKMCVQNKLRDAVVTVRRWLADDAVMYVAVLREWSGTAKRRSTTSSMLLLSSS